MFTLHCIGCGVAPATKVSVPGQHSGTLCRPTSRRCVLLRYHFNLVPFRFAALIIMRLASGLVVGFESLLVLFFCIFSVSDVR